ncbi:MAG TPA: Ig-like domain-containing protein, partial [Thermoanaerobaculia bacterium]|nr:Ig-like domain-containing protein [Thermoanaerobaculia bacterium]
LLPTAASTCGGPSNPQCDNFALTVVPPSYAFRLEVVLTPGTANDYDLEVYDSGGTLAGSSGNGPGDPETVILTNPPGGIYTVSASPFAPVGPYVALARIVPDTGTPPPGSADLELLHYGAPAAGEPNATFFPRFGYGPSFGDAGIGLSSGEPTLGSPHALNVAQQATAPYATNVMFLDYIHTLRVTFDDCTDPATAEWREKSVPTHVTSLDPILHVDPATGRTISAQLAGKTSLIGLSDDLGETWSPSQGAGINSGVDHQTIGAGPFPPGDPGGLGYPNAVYYASQDIAQAQIALSRDGGTTFGPALPMYTIAQCGGLHGHIQVSPQGVVAVPNKSCGGEQGLAVSENAGITFVVRTVPGSTTGRSDPAAGFGADETLYFGYCDASGAAMAAVSSDLGANWSAPQNVGAAYGLVNCAFPEVIAGDGDRAAFAFLGSATPGDGTAANPDYDGVWHLYLAVTYDRGVTWSTIRATPGDPVQRGAICLQGTTCASGRNLLDFNDIAMDEKGRVLVGYADGCVGGCLGSGPNSGTDVGRITRLAPGSKGLLAAFDDVLQPTSPTAPRTPYLEARRFGGRVDLEWSVPFDGGSPILHYDVYRRQSTSTFHLLTTIPAGTTTYSDDGVDLGGDYVYRVLAVSSAGASDACAETPAAAPAVVDPCSGVQVASDATGEQPVASLDVESLTIAEPFVADGAGGAVPMLVFDLEVASAALTAPTNAWIVLWSRKDAPPALPNDYDRNMVNMRMTAGGPECHFGKVTAASVNRGDDVVTLPAANCTLRPDGHLTIILPPGVIDDCQQPGSLCTVGAGYELSGLEVRVFASNVSGQPVSQASAADSVAGLTYRMVGNAFCAPNRPPIAVADHVAWVSIGVPVVIDVVANDSDPDGDSLTVTAVSDGAHGTVTNNGDGTVTYTANASAVCSDQFSYTLSDPDGALDVGIVTAEIGLPFADAFESGSTARWCGVFP